MNIVLMRHGEARPQLYDDYDRKLTRRGGDLVQKTGQIIAARLEAPVILSSPYIRAQQTAGLLHAQLFGNASDQEPIRICESITPGGEPQTVLASLAKIDKATVVLVTHQPFVSRFVNYLTGSTVAFSTASVVAIQMDLLATGYGDILWECHHGQIVGQ